MVDRDPSRLKATEPMRTEDGPPPHSSVTKSTAILPLPAEVAAQIKSSTTITSLTSVVIGLLQNSLDAAATKITVDVNFSRGNCTVEDNGLGIAPSEFAESGGLGKLYHTSKYARSNRTYGTHGTFLASLGAMCLMTITSKHHQHYSTNSLILHHSKVKSRLVPAPALHRLNNAKQGTRVTVRDLFGNMPVRVKQRAVFAYDQQEAERLWEDLKNALLALLIAFGFPVTVRLRDILSGKSMSFVPPSCSGAPRTSMLSTKHQLALSLLQQAGKISSSTNGKWIPASASSKTVTINGVICLEPAPTKGFQYLSLGVLPLLKTSYHMLYDHINKVFSRSHFGAVPENELSEAEKLRRQNDRRYKVDGLTRKQMVIEKGVDRWPMFVLHTEFKESQRRTEDPSIKSDASLNALTRVLDALLTSWLDTHHFQPQKNAETKKNARARSESAPTPSLSSSHSSEAEAGGDALSCSDTRVQAPRPYTGVATINGLSRIKSSHRLSFAVSNIKLGHPETVSSTVKSPSDKSPSKRSAIGIELATSEWPKKRQARVESMEVEREREPPQHDDRSLEGQLIAPSQYGFEDEAIGWTDPITKQNHRLNVRTGMVLPQSWTANKEEPGNVSAMRVRPLPKRLSLPSRPASSATIQENKTQWLDKMLDTWNNPVFKAAEASISRAQFQLPFESNSNGHQCRHVGKEMCPAFEAVARLNESKITKSALKNANVIGQVDDKFILVRVRSDEIDDAKSLLVMIDQHAADERVKVEQLLRELCAPSDNLDTQISSQSTGVRSATTTMQLGKPLKYNVSIQESQLFRQHASHFAAWGILYGLDMQGSKDAHLTVTSIPPLIAERCTSEPKLLISLLRSEMWRHEESGVRTMTGQSVASKENDSRGCIKRIATCPPALLNMINSRACRSAIMFNDALSKDECESLIARLADCAFPFQCAHGRPSMVPLLDLGTTLNEDENRELGMVRQEPNEENYADAFVRWRAGIDESMASE